MTTGPSPATRELVPDWLDHLAGLAWRVLAIVVLGLVLVWLAGVLGTVTASILVALIVAATFAPYVLGLRNRGWSRLKAAAAVFLGAAAVIGITLLLIALSFAPYVPQVIDFVQSGLAKLESDLAAASVPPDVISSIDSVVTAAKTWLSDSVGAIAGAVASVATVVILGGFLTFFLLMDGDKAWFWLSQFGSDWQRERVSESGHEAVARVGGYLRGTAILAATDAISDFIFLWLLGVPLAGPLAVLVFFGGFIPYIGGFVTTSVLVLVTLSTQGVQAVVLLLLGITVMNIVQGNFLAPIIYGKTVHIHPAIVLLALPAGAALWGIVGLFAVIPVVALIMAVTGSLIEVIAPEPAGDTLIPGWLDRLAQWSWRLLVVLALLGAGIALAVQLPAVVIPIVLAIVIAATLSPLAQRLRQRGWRPTTAALTATGGGFLIAMAILLLALWQLVDQAGQIATTADQGAIVGRPVGQCAGRVGGGHQQRRRLGDRRDGRRGHLRHRRARPLSRPRRARLLLLPARRGAGLAEGDVAAERLAPTRGDRGRPTSGGRPRRVHDRDRRDLAVRCGHPGADHVGARAAPRPPAGGPVVLRRVHPVHRLVHHDRDRVPRDRRGRQHAGHHRDGPVHRRLQHRPGQLRRPARLRQGRQHPPGDHPDGDSRPGPTSPAWSGCSSSCRSSASWPRRGGRSCSCSATSLPSCRRRPSPTP